MAAFSVLFYKANKQRDKKWIKTPNKEFWWKTGSGSVIKTIYCYFEQGSAVLEFEYSLDTLVFRVRDRDRDRDNLANVVGVKSNRKKKFVNLLYYKN